MLKIDVETKREIDSELTKQLLNIETIRNNLEQYTNRFLKKFHTDTYLLFNAIRIHELCSISVKGGLGIANLEAQLQNRAPDKLVWNNYIGDCDLNLIINKKNYPDGKTTGDVFFTVAKRLKILLTETINDNRYSTLVKDIKARNLQPPLYRCSQVETLAHIIDFVSQDLPLIVPEVVNRDRADVKVVVALLKEVIPGLVGICGQNLQTVFDIVTGSTSNDWIIFDDRIKNILFVSDLNTVKSSWTDVDYSFFPYAPGRMDSLGYEVNELAIRQQIARQANPPDIDQEATLPYDIFKIAITPFVYTKQDTTNTKIDPHDDELFQPIETYNLSMYANNLIDDFALIRTALQFSGYALRRKDVQAANPGNKTYWLDVRSGSGKCEFVDVAIPRIGSSEWFYCQDREYYIKIPENQPNAPWVFKVCNFDYQVEENLNLLVELGCGLSHSEHKAGKRISRLSETWIRCNYQNVFPREPSSQLPPGVTEPFTAPASLVTNITQDYLNLFGLGQLPNWLYNEIFCDLRQFKLAVDTYIHNGQGEKDKTTVILSAKNLGQKGLMEIMCMADVIDGAAVSTLRELLENGDIEANWVLASYLLLKASPISDIIWFPRYGIFKVIQPDEVKKKFQIVTDNNQELTAQDFVAVMWDAPEPGHTLTLFTLPTEDVIVPNAPIKARFYGKNLDTSKPQIYNEIRKRLMRANNQMLRVSYGMILNCLLRASANAYMSDVL